MNIDDTTLDNTIFLVDDDENILYSLKDIFEIFGFKTQAYSSAVDYLRELDDRQGCLVCDVSMPEMTGIELLSELNKVEHLRPTLFLTGVATIDMAVEAMELGAVGFMEKPVATEVLLKKVLDAIENFKPILETIHDYQTLTFKERPVFDLIVKGVTNNDIAEQLEFSVSTIEKHRASVMKKMQADSLALLMIKIPNLRPLGLGLEINNL
jgi:two-component system response regulator FixJ